MNKKKKTNSCRKAQEYHLGTAIMTIVIIIFAISVILIIRDQQNQSVFNLKCTQSIEAHILDVKLHFTPKPIQCPTQYITIKEKESTDIMKQLARQQVLCWNQWKKGEEELFIENEGVFCHICVIDEFNKKIVLDDYINFLKNTKLSSVAPEYVLKGASDPFLFDYLSPEGSGKIDELIKEADETESLLQEMAIDTSEEQAVIFFYAKGESRLRQFVRFFFGRYTWGTWQTARFSGITVQPYTEQTLLDMGCEIIPSSQEENT